ncbi:MAG: site-2 protease family protein [Desulfomicrobium sp.]|jgi:Zn-dependent protease|nr:site-2 protease family protein [Desulfomicrobium sp.]
MFDFNFSQAIQQISIMAIPFFLGITCHEVAHGYVSYLMGDPTAKLAGRLTLNPLKHLDPMGTLVLVLTQLIGWAKPVPINPNYYKDYRRGVLYVSLAGPMANFIVMLFFVLILKILVYFSQTPSAVHYVYILRPMVNIALAGIIINAILGTFNLLPIPPLDGSKVLACLLPGAWVNQFMRLERYGFLILLLLAFTGVLGQILRPVITLVQTYLINPQF